MILSCDAVITEAEKVLSASYKLTIINKREDNLTKIVLDCFPAITAARFFYVTRSSLMRILGYVVSFFIVMVQIRQV